MPNRIPALVLTALALFSTRPAKDVEFKRVYPLRPEEGVFAYARITPDGRQLAYASELKDPARNNRIVQTVTVVDLPSQKIQFTEEGIDAYWSLDGKRMIYSSNEMRSVSMRDEGGAITRNVAPAQLGDYYSWAVRDGRNLILTIQSNYYYLNGNTAELPASHVQPCPGIGVGDRPLISKDGKRISTFVRGNVVVRGLTDCENTIDTGLNGQKADFSWDGRYIAFHIAKPNGVKGYDIVVVDLEKKTMRTITAGFTGSSLFPSWTRDGRLCFRYDGDDYRGFMMASNVLGVPERPLPAAASRTAVGRPWSSIFPETKTPSQHLSLVLIWATWSAHSPVALADMQRAQDFFRQRKMDVSIMTATDPGSLESDVARLVSAHHVELPRIPLAPTRLSAADAGNQMPTTLLFRDGQLVDRKLGAQSFDQLAAWVSAADGPRQSSEQHK